MKRGALWPHDTCSRALFALVFAAATLACSVRLARASYEEFRSVDLGKPEEDDESLLDHYLVRPPANWHDEWWEASGSFRSSQGCLTAGRWYTDNLFRLRAPMGDTTKLDLEMLQVEDDEAQYQWLHFGVRFPLPRLGLWGVRFTPAFEKSRQDAALLWDAGNARSPFQLQAVMGVEDVFNNFWQSRQSQVNKEEQPYERHPFEPALRMFWRGAGPRVAIGGKWLTPLVKRYETQDPSLRHTERLWGVKGDAAVAQRIGRATADLGFEMLQASSWDEWDAIAGDHRLYSRRWRVEGGVSYPYGEHARLSARFIYQERFQLWGPPIADAKQDCIDRMPTLEASFRLPLEIGSRVGYMHDIITVVREGNPPTTSYGTRNENRIYLSLEKRFGRVLVQGVEGIELDHEGYDVAFVHDKGFVHVQVPF